MVITVDKVYAVYNETIKYIGAYEKAKEVFGIPKLESDFLAKAGEGGLFSRGHFRQLATKVYCYPVGS